MEAKIKRGKERKIAARVLNWGSYATPSNGHHSSTSASPHGSGHTLQKQTALNYSFLCLRLKQGKGSTLCLLPFSLLYFAPPSQTSSSSNHISPPHFLKGTLVNSRMVHSKLSEVWLVDDDLAFKVGVGGSSPPWCGATQSLSTSRYWHILWALWGFLFMDFMFPFSMFFPHGKWFSTLFTSFSPTLSITHPYDFHKSCFSLSFQKIYNGSFWTKNPNCFLAYIFKKNSNHSFPCLICHQLFIKY